MEIIEEACLLSIMVSTILDMAKYPSFIFNWNTIKFNNLQSSYNYDDCKLLLQLSFMITSNNYQGNSLNCPLEDTPLVYYSCPVPFMAKAANSNNNPTKLGHVLYDPNNNVVFIIFTGTINACMVSIDLTHVQTEIDQLLNYQPGMRAHRGIYNAYLSIREQLIKILGKYLSRKPQIVITGHSLGGGLSQLCAFDLAYYNPIHYFFGSPLIFNDLAAFAFDNFVKNSYRVINLSDIVTFSPFPVMPNGDIFCNVGTLVSFQRNLGKLPLNHSRAYAEEYNLQFKLDNTIPSREKLMS
jgi:hypothetical protein